MAYYRNPSDVTALPAWQALSQHRQAMQDFSMRDAFNADPQRFSQFTLSSCGLFLDYSKNLITGETQDLLVNLANEVGLKEAIQAQYDGELVNSSEGRPALHTALRRPVGDKLLVNGVNVMPEVHKVLNQITELVGRIHDGLWRGYTEKPITDVVNIGIGGSFLGPELVSEALLSYAHKGVRCHYLANIDGSEFHELSMKIRAETTLFIVSSKSFNTLETLKNAQAARSWYLAQGGSEGDLYKHFIAVSSNREAAVAFGIREENIFPMWDWAEERATDADVDHVSDRLLGVTAPQTIVDAAHEVGDLVQHFMHVGHHVDAVDRQLVAHRATQRGVQRRTAFGRVDDFALEQRLDRALQIDFVGQADQQVTGFGVDQVLRVVKKQAAAAEGELSKTLRVGIKGLAHAEILHGLAVVFQRLPGGQGGHVVRSAVVRHRCGFPFYLNGLLNTKNPGAPWVGVRSTASTRFHGTGRIQ